MTDRSLAAHHHRAHRPNYRRQKFLTLGWFTMPYPPPFLMNTAIGEHGLCHEDVLTAPGCVLPAQPPCGAVRGDPDDPGGWHIRTVLGARQVEPQSERVREGTQGG